MVVDRKSESWIGEKSSNPEESCHLGFFFLLKRVEKASEFAVSQVFSAGNSNLSRRLWGQLVDLETPEQIEDHEEVYAEGKRKYIGSTTY